jgi:tRNA threonylcarbamoyladenosine biosynthesis protein TsaE
MGRRYSIPEQSALGEFAGSLANADQKGIVLQGDSLTLELPDLAATEALGRRLGRLLFPGAVVGLIGPLGAGKTQLVRAIAEGLEISDPRVVSSPTFVLIQEYDARLPIYHFDVYRLQGEAEFEELGPAEYFQGRGVSLVEWADRVPGAMPAERLEARLEVVSETARRIQITAMGERYQNLLAELTADECK